MNLTKKIIISIMLIAFCLITFSFKTVIAKDLTIIDIDSIIREEEKIDNIIPVPEHILDYSLAQQDTLTFSNKNDYSVWNGSLSDDTLAYEYGEIKQRDESTSFYLTTIGGKTPTQLKFYDNKFNSISTKDGVMFYVDSRGIYDSSDLNIEFNLYISNTTYPSGSTNALYVPFIPRNNSFFYSYDIYSGDWNSTIINNNRLLLQENFNSYIYIPFISFIKSSESGYGVIPNDTITNGISSGYIFPRIFKFTFLLNDNAESQTRIIIDNLSFVKLSSTTHTHNYSYYSHVSSSCVINGYDIYKCDICENIIYQNIEELLPHNYINDICAVCGKVEDGKNIGNENVVTFTFNYGSHFNEEKVYLRKGQTVRYENIPLKFTYIEDLYTYTFNCWTIDEDCIDLVNPIGIVASSDMTFYARFINSSYDNIKYRQMTSIFSMNGGYNITRGTVVFSGDSNTALNTMLVHDLAPQIPAYNNSVAGSTSYDKIMYLKPLVLQFRPKIAVINMTSNDVAYHNMSNKAVRSNIMFIFDQLQKYCPDSILVVPSMNPVPGRSEYWEWEYRINQWFIENTADLKYFEFVDGYDAAMEASLRYPDGWEFWTHYDLEGLRASLQTLKLKLLELMVEYNITF
ncbi:MAG: SGNH/GDSL hydrolase family protein [Acholeplasmatales bacterium]|jgi:hypothetical protein|nr:SGNH/GDSL hydrolase family protein [Acholeplasmatales bacterium]